MAEQQTGDLATIMLAALGILGVAWAGIKWVFARGEAYNKLNGTITAMESRMGTIEDRFNTAEKRANERHLSLEAMIASVFHSQTGRNYIKPFKEDEDE